MRGVSRLGQRPACARDSCGWRASRPSGLCGTHDNERLRAEQRRAQAASRAEFRARRLAEASAATQLLWRVGVRCEPSLVGVLLPAEEAQRVARLLAARQGRAEGVG